MKLILLVFLCPPAASFVASGFSKLHQAARLDRRSEGTSSSTPVRVLAGKRSQWREGKQTWAQACEPYPGKRVILVQVNSQYVEFFRNWLFHASRFWNPQIDQLVVAAESNRTVATLRALSGLFGVQWDVQYIGSSGEDAKEQSSYAKGVWTKVVKHRPMQILQLLEQGCSVLYSDIDLVFLRPVFPAIDSEGKYAAYIGDDSKRGKKGGRKLCTCLMYFHPTAANQRLMERWVEDMTRPSVKVNQRSFNRVIRDMKAHKLVNYHVLPRRTFVAGWATSDAGQITSSDKKTMARAVTLHANWVVGQEKKIEKLSHLGFWEPEGNKSKSKSR